MGDGGEAARLGEARSALKTWPGMGRPHPRIGWGLPGRPSDLALRQVLSWWAMLGSNQRPPRCERGALPLRQSPWRPQTTRLLVAGTLAGQHRLAYPRGAWRRREGQDSPVRPVPGESGAPVAAA